MNKQSERMAELDRIEQEAASWVLRRDRGLTSAEMGEFIHWLAADPRHRENLASHGILWRQLDELAELGSADDGSSDPDLLAAPSRRLRWMLPLSLAAAAAVAVLVWWPRRLVPAAASGRPTAGLVRVETRDLPDGSEIELNRGAAVTVAFTPGERRVYLNRGEAHFKVAKNPARPFVVVAGGFSVRAVGTAFDVNLRAAAVAVIVTEGRVRLDAPAPAGKAPSYQSQTASVSAPLPVIVAGQRAIMSLAPGGGPPQIATLSAAESDQLLAWRPRLLDYTAAPLREIVAEFNRHNPEKIMIADPELGAMRITASFSSDNIDGFVRLLEASFGVRAKRHGNNEIALYKSP